MRYQLMCLVLVVICASSCMTKRYGKHFNNNVYSNHHKSKVTQLPPPEYLASTSQVLSPELKEAKFEPNTSGAETKITTEKEAIGLSYQFPLMRYNKASKKSNVLDEPGRKMEPQGVTAFGLGVLGTIGLISTFSSGAAVGLAMLAILGGAVLGIASLVKIKRNKAKWKGKGFGISAIVILGTWIILFGLVIAIILSTGYS